MPQQGLREKAWNRAYRDLVLHSLVWQEKQNGGLPASEPSLLQQHTRPAN